VTVVAALIPTTMPQTLSAAPPSHRIIGPRRPTIAPAPLQLHPRLPTRLPIHPLPSLPAPALPPIPAVTPPPTRQRSPRPQAPRPVSTTSSPPRTGQQSCPAPTI